jgi:TldD protein
LSAALDIATADLLHPGGLGEAELTRTLGQLMDRRLDLADMYFQATRFESWFLEDGIVKDGSFNIDQGVGVRAVSGEKTGFAYSDEIVLPALTQSARAARAIAHDAGGGKVQAWHRQESRDLYTRADPLNSLAERERIALLESVDTFARALDPRVKEVNVGLSGEYTRVMMVASDGTFSADVRPLVRLNVGVIVEQNGRREQASAGGGGRYDYGYFRDEERAMGYAREAVRRAVVNLESGGARRHHDRGAGTRVARRAAPRGHRPRPGRRLQSQGELGVRRAHRRDGRIEPVHGRR